MTAGRSAGTPARPWSVGLAWAVLLAVVDQTMQPTRASLWLRPSVTATGRG